MARTKFCLGGPIFASKKWTTGPIYPRQNFGDGIATIICTEILSSIQGFAECLQQDSSNLSKIAVVQVAFCPGILPRSFAKIERERRAWYPLFVHAPDFPTFFDSSVLLLSGYCIKNSWHKLR